MIRRREFITLLGGAATWPLAAHAQQPAMPVIGFLQPTSRDANADRLRAFHQGLKESGYIEGENIAIEYRFAENQNDRLPALAADLVRRQVAAITAMPAPAALAAKAATSTIPIVFLLANDPVAMGLVASLNRPGGNVTGLANLNNEITSKRLGLLYDLVPGAVRFAALVDRKMAAPESVAEFSTAAAAFGKPIEVFTAGTPAEIDAAFASLKQKQVGALLVRPSPFFVDRRIQLVMLAAHHGLPAIYHDRQFSEAGGLMSYGTSLADQLRQVGIYTGRVLKGEKPGDLPVLQPTKFELVINLKTAKALGLTVPPSLLAVADEVIE
jgi:putative tryptophan/tyrosine transport system substrate-binding protein